MNKILEVFYENPGKQFTVRELARLINIPRSTTHKYLVSFKKENLITSNNSSNDDYLLFKIKKINYYAEKIVESGLIDQIISKLSPSCIILFGSFRKGESYSQSDIDLFVETQLSNTINLEKYEKKLKHTIQIFTETDINKLPEKLLNNVVNGIKLFGSFNIK